MFKENKKQLNLTLIALLAFAMLSGVSCSSSEKGEEPLSPEEKAEKRFSFLKKGDQAHSKSYETIDAERVVFKSDSPVRLTAEELKKLESPALVIYCNAGVGGTQVNTDNFSHDKCSSNII